LPWSPAGPGHEQHCGQGCRHPRASMGPADRVPDRGFVARRLMLNGRAGCPPSGSPPEQVWYDPSLVRTSGCLSGRWASTKGDAGWRDTPSPSRTMPAASGSAGPCRSCPKTSRGATSTRRLIGIVFPPSRRPSPTWNVGSAARGQRRLPAALGRPPEPAPDLVHDEPSPWGRQPVRRQTKLDNSTLFRRDTWRDRTTRSHPLPETPESATDVLSCGDGFLCLVSEPCNNDVTPASGSRGRTRLIRTTRAGPLDGFPTPMKNSSILRVAP
jgi:hypothetical protein